MRAEIHDAEEIRRFDALPLQVKFQILSHFMREHRRAVGEIILELFWVKLSLAALFLMISMLAIVEMG